jgi:hypothetical protein
VHISTMLGHEHLLVDLHGLWATPPPERTHLADQEPMLDNRGELVRNPRHLLTLPR